MLNTSDNMKWTPILHGIAATAGVLGLLALILWWISLGTGWAPFGVTPDHIYRDATALLLTSVAFGIGTLIHLKREV